MTTNSNTTNSERSCNELMGKLNNEYNEMIKLSELEIGVEYEIITQKLINTKRWKALIVSISRDGNKEYDVFLPDRYIDLLIGDHHVPRLSIIYHGLKESRRKGMKYHDIKFKQMDS